MPLTPSLILLTQGDGTSGTGWNYWDGDFATDPVAPWDVGSGSEELNGTFDMMGNLFEWNETIDDQYGAPYRGVRGGSFESDRFTLMSSWGLHRGDPIAELRALSFRVASVPEPATLLLLSLGAIALRKKH